MQTNCTYQEAKVAEDCFEYIIQWRQQFGVNKLREK